MAADHTGTAPPRAAPDVRTVETSQLRRAGLKITIPRVKILEILASSSTLRHMSAEDVYRRLLDQTNAPA